MSLVINDSLAIPEHLLQFRFSRASGPGGQNVNKVSSRVELLVEVASLPLPPDALERLRSAAGRKVSAAGVLTLVCQLSRDQAANRVTCLERLKLMVLAALHRPRNRVPTRPSRAARERRLEGKHQRSATKATRGRRPADD
jgi:ribosome-associated protein